MTTPEERRRNWIWGREMLDELKQDERFSLGDRQHTAALLEAYPSEQRLITADEDDLDRIAEEFIDVLSASRRLFLRLHVDDAMSEARRRALLVILRHFS